VLLTLSLKEVKDPVFCEMASFGGNVEGAATLEQIKTEQAKGSKLMLFFWAPWHEPSKAGGQLQEAFALLAKKHATTIKFITVEAENAPEISEYCQVEVVPTYVAFSGLSTVGRLDHVNPPELVRLATKLSNAAVPQQIDPAEAMKKKLDALVNQAPIMLFMKGNPESPKCKFSRAMIEILKENGIIHGYFDILQDEEVRAELKLYSEWPTYPQLFVGGVFQGGIDIVKEMVEAAQLAGGDSLRVQLGIDALEADLAKAVARKQQTLEERLVALTHQDKVMLFMKGDRHSPKCGFSRTMVGILNDEGIKYSTFDILEDDEVRQGLKAFSEWPTYPQLYVDGNLIGGLDIVQEMREDGDGSLKEQLEL
jgi:Grx4 family monothiol glutaredoxin